MNSSTIFSDWRLIWWWEGVSPSRVELKTWIQLQIDQCLIVRGDDERLSFTKQGRQIASRAIPDVDLDEFIELFNQYVKDKLKK